MAGSQSIGSLNAQITGDAGQIMGVLNQVQAGIDRMNQTVASQAPLTEKSAVRAGVAMYGLNAVFRAGGTEVMHVISNIEHIPGVPAETIASVQMFKGELALARTALDGLIAKGVAGFTNMAVSIGASLGGMVYGFDNVDEGMKRMQADLEQAIRSSPAYREEVEKLGDELRKVNDQRKTMFGSKGFQLDLLGKQAAGAQLASQNFAPDDIQGIKLQLEAAQKLLAVDRGVLELKRELATEQEKTLVLTARESEASLSPRLRLAALLEREAKTRQDLAFYTKVYDKTQNPQALDLMVGKQKELNAELTEQVRLEQKIGEVAKDVGSAVADNFEQAILQGKKLGDMLNSLALDLEKILLRRFITTPLADFVTGGLDSLFGLPGKHAGGGNMAAGELGLVGEEGPELFRPSTAGLVVPASATKAMTGGGRGGTFMIDARGADRAGLSRLESMIRGLNGSLEYRAVSALIDYQRRGLAANGG